jgi:hypothetical protein
VLAGAGPITLRAVTPGRRLPAMISARALLFPLVALVASAAMLEPASASATPTITVGPGDAMSVRGSDIECVVSTAAPRAIVCGIGSEKALSPRSYAITIADKGAAIFVATGSQRTVARAINPAISGAPFKGSSHKPTSYVVAQHEHVILAGTHVACGALLIDQNETFGCGIYKTSSGTSGYYVAGTYAVTLSDRFAGILRAGKNGAQTVVAEDKEP